jgi:PhzF family phenazine biosynthesis protein
MKLKVYTLNAFAKTKTGGNPAGIVLGADSLSARVMQKIAGKVGFSETAFIQKSNKADFKVRFFTPNGEVDLCGHATIAAFYLLAKKKILKPGKYTQETKAGILDINVKKDKTIFMNQKLPVYLNKIDKKEIAKSLNVSEEIISDNLPIQIVSTGLKDILIPIRSLKELHKIKPDFKKISRISKKYNVVGYHLFTFETKFDSTAHCRNFAPLYDIPEESATGTSNGALSCYLFKYGEITKKQTNKLVFEQGYSMKKPSEILVKLKIQNNRIVTVNVGGSATNIKERELVIT